MDAPRPQGQIRDKPGAWVDLALTLPVFLAYHIGVVFLPMKNASDYVTRPLLALANGNRGGYIAITSAIGVIFAGIFALLGRGHAFRPVKFVQIAGEGILYAIAMRFGASYVVGRLPIGGMKDVDPVTGVVMSLGAGFYEELAFRVFLFGLGAKLLVWLFARPVARLGAPPQARGFRALVVTVLWSVVAAAVFSGAHYVGSLGDTPAIGSFVFRLVLGLALTLIFATRGFAAAVWAHAAYDIWVMVL
jgi:Type II CAAX prenyl endopeptidase Rce1-like